MRKTIALSVLLGASAIAAAAIATIAVAEPGEQKIPALASRAFGWQSNVADWQEPPAGTPGHGPIRPDPAHPFVSNAEAGRLGIQRSEEHTSEL